MRKKNTEALSEIIPRLLKEQGLDRKLNEKHIIDAWPLVLGDNISQYTTDLSVRNGVLYVSLSSAVLRQDLFMSRQEIIVALNKKVGGETIVDIVFR